MHSTGSGSSRHRHGNWATLGGVTAIVGIVWVASWAAHSPMTATAMAAEVVALDAVGQKPHNQSASRCAECHQFQGVLSHPVNVRPTIGTPAYFPLENGRMTCTTCHDTPLDHRDESVPVGVRGTSTGAAMCVQCHSGSDQRGKGVHALAIGKAHLSVFERFGKRSQSEPADLESRTCVGCHDGVMASEAGSHGVRLGDDEALKEHPFDVPLVATERTKHGEFKMVKPGALDQRVRLFRGNMGCGSCHSVYSKEPGQLVVSNRGSGLCLSCHKQ